MARVTKYMIASIGVNRCSHCGAGLAKVDVLTRTQRRIYETIRANPGLKAKELTLLVYGRIYVDPNAIGVHVHGINRRLRPQGVQIQNRRGSGQGYSVVTLP